jgi:hypothetical protein
VLAKKADDCDILLTNRFSHSPHKSIPLLLDNWFSLAIVTLDCRVASKFQLSAERERKVICAQRDQTAHAKNWCRFVSLSVFSSLFCKSCFVWNFKQQLTGIHNRNLINFFIFHSFSPLLSQAQDKKDKRIKLEKIYNLDSEWKWTI